MTEADFNKEFWLGGPDASLEQYFPKSGRRPLPLYGQSDAVLYGASSQKLVFFC